MPPLEQAAITSSGDFPARPCEAGSGARSLGRWMRLEVPGASAAVRAGGSKAASSLTSALSKSFNTLGVSQMSLSMPSVGICLLRKAFIVGWPFKSAIVGGPGDEGTSWREEEDENEDEEGGDEDEHRGDFPAGAPVAAGPAPLRRETRPAGGGDAAAVVEQRRRQQRPGVGARDAGGGGGGVGDAEVPVEPLRRLPRQRRAAPSDVVQSPRTTSDAASPSSTPQDCASHQALPRLDDEDRGLVSRQIEDASLEWTFHISGLRRRLYTPIELVLNARDFVKPEQARVGKDFECPWIIGCDLDLMCTGFRGDKLFLSVRHWSQLQVVSTTAFTLDLSLKKVVGTPECPNSKCQRPITIELIRPPAALRELAQVRGREGNAFVASLWVDELPTYIKDSRRRDEPPPVAGAPKVEEISDDEGDESEKVAMKTLQSFQGIIADALLLGYTLQKHCRTQRRILLVTGDLSPICGHQLLSYFWEIRKVEHVKVHPDFLMKCEGRFSRVFTKLRCFELEEFRKIVFMDLDLLVRHKLDLLFNAEAPAACFRGNFDAASGHRRESISFWDRDGNRQGGINAGVMVLEPSRDDFEEMHRKLIRGGLDPDKASTCPEQDFLTQFFCQRGWNKLDLNYNFQLHQLGYIRNEDMSIERRMAFEHLAVLHFSGDYGPREWVFQRYLHDDNYAEFKPKYFEDYWKHFLKAKYKNVKGRDAETLWKACQEWWATWTDKVVVRLGIKQRERGWGTLCKTWGHDDEDEFCDQCWRRTQVLKPQLSTATTYASLEQPSATAGAGRKRAASTMRGGDRKRRVMPLRNRGRPRDRGGAASSPRSHSRSRSPGPGARRQPQLSSFIGAAPEQPMARSRVRTLSPGRRSLPYVPRCFGATTGSYPAISSTASEQCVGLQRFAAPAEQRSWEAAAQPRVPAAQVPRGSTAAAPQRGGPRVGGAMKPHPPALPPPASMLQQQPQQQQPPRMEPPPGEPPQQMLRAAQRSQALVPQQRASAKRLPQTSRPLLPQPQPQPRPLAQPPLNPQQERRQRQLRPAAQWPVQPRPELQPPHLQPPAQPPQNAQQERRPPRRSFQPQPEQLPPQPHLQPRTQGHRPQQPRPELGHPPPQLRPHLARAVQPHQPRGPPPGHRPMAEAVVFRAAAFSG
mmetsp:Transcript_154168/g.494183  ORF Transcript_154168/g.494183 Transcript_154168/m.494183 type:complete len:1145 (+) Transcript_154168:1368-4802(+)